MGMRRLVTSERMNMQIDSNDHLYEKRRRTCTGVIKAEKVAGTYGRRKKTIDPQAGCRYLVHTPFGSYSRITSSSCAPGGTVSTQSAASLSFQPVCSCTFSMVVPG